MAKNYVSTPAAGTPPNCGSSPPDGVIVSRGHNLESGGDCGFTGTRDLQNTDPKLFDGAANNGGNTDTYALDATSPAVDAIPRTFPGCGPDDQRDIARPQGVACDIGAYELLQATVGRSFAGVLGCRRHPNDSEHRLGRRDPAIERNGRPEHPTGERHPHLHRRRHLTSRQRQQSRHLPFQLKVFGDAPLSATPRACMRSQGRRSPARWRRSPTPTREGPRPTSRPPSIGATERPPPGASRAAARRLRRHGTHTYSAQGTYPTTITITDVDGAHTAANGTATFGAPTGVGAAQTAVTDAPTVNSSSTAALRGTRNPHDLPTTGPLDLRARRRRAGPGIQRQRL